MVIRQERLLAGYVTFLAVTALTLMATLLVLGYRVESPFVVLGLALATAVSERWDATPFVVLVFSNTMWP